MILCGLNREKVGENMTADALQREIILSGPLYRNEINALLTGLTRCLEEGEIMLALDFSRVEYFDCAGLGALLYVHQQAQKRGARFHPLIPGNEIRFFKSGLIAKVTFNGGNEPFEEFDPVHSRHFDVEGHDVGTEKDYTIPGRVGV